jgi:hypothetical protein
MPAPQRRRLLDDITCVCVLLKALMQKFEREQGAGSAAVAKLESSTLSWRAEGAADARKRQKEAL